MTVPVPDQLEFVSDANGVTKDFPYPKRFLQKDEIVVVLRNTDGIDTPQILGTHYTIAGSSWPTGGTVSFMNAPQVPNKVVRYRMTQAKQTVDLENKQRNDAKAVEVQLDRLTMAIQDRGNRTDSAWFGLLAEIIARKAGDAALNSRVDQEVADRKNGDNALASLIGQSLIGSDHFFETQLALTFAIVSPLFKIVALGGYSIAGDAPHHMMVRVAAEPTHPGKRRSLDRFMPDGSISLSNGGWWELVNFHVTVEMFGARGSGVADDAPAFRACRDFMVAMGGGTIRAPRTNYRFASVETKFVKNIVTDGQFDAFLFLPAAVSFKGAGKYVTKFITAPPNNDTEAFVAPIEYKNGVISDFELHGHTKNGDAMHGIFCVTQVNFSHILENVEYSNLFIHDVGSYGISNQFQVRNVKVKGVECIDTGADGIDWKVRGPQVEGLISDSVVMDDITVRRFGQRSGAGSPSGIGIRGTAKLTNINVFEIPDGLPGVEFVAGTALVAISDFRRSASMSSIDNWYCEGANPKGTAIAIHSYASFAVTIGQGVAKYAVLQSDPAATTPYGFDDGSHFHDIVCIPSHGGRGFYALQAGTSFGDVRVISDKVYFDAKRDNLQTGQTVFDLSSVGGSSTRNGAPRYVVKNGVTLTETTHYTWQANSVTLVTPVIASDTVMVIFPPVHPVRLEALYCTVTARLDRWCPWIAISTQAQVDTSVLEIVWDGHRGITQHINEDVSGIYATSGVAGGNRNLRLSGHGTGLVEIDRPRGINLPTSASGLARGQFWNDAGTLKVAT